MSNHSRELLEVKRVRHQIDKIDDKILDLLKERRELAINLVPIELEVHLKDHEKRVKEVLDRIELRADCRNMNGKRVRGLWKHLITYIIQEQEDTDHPIH